MPIIWANSTQKAVVSAKTQLFLKQKQYIEDILIAFVLEMLVSLSVVNPTLKGKCPVPKCFIQIMLNLIFRYLKGSD